MTFLKIDRRNLDIKERSVKVKFSSNSFGRPSEINTCEYM